MRCFLILIVPPIHRKYPRNPSSPSKGVIFTQKCPVTANPLPTCTWNFSKPHNEIVKTLPNLQFSNNNCTMTVRPLTTAYEDVDYHCNATNKYGNITEFLTAISILSKLLIYKLEFYLSSCLIYRLWILFRATKN